MSIQSTDLSRHESGGSKPLAVPVKRACEIIGVGNTTMYELIKQKRVRTIKIGRRTLCIYASLEALLTSETAS
jgi:excisionase family DNA binding protein